MLSQERRISKALFEQILKEGRSFHTKDLSLRVCPKKDGGISAFSFVIPSRVVKIAVKRNTIKRRSRHVIKKHLNLIREGYLCAFFLKKDLSPLPFPLLEAQILDGLRMANLLK